MVKTSYPFDSTPVATEAEWEKMARLWRAPGVVGGDLNELSVFGDSTGMQVKVSSGRAYIEGQFFESDAEEILPIAAADPANPRNDRVVLRRNFATNQVELAVLQGVPNAAPVDPVLTQVLGGTFEIPLARVRVNAAAATIAAGDVTNQRQRLITPGLQFARKTGSESVASSIALQDDDHLTFAIGANEVWMVDYMLAVTGAAAGDFQMALAVPAGVTGRRFRLGPETATANVSATLIAAHGSFDLTSGMAFGVDGTNQSTVWIRAIVVGSTTAGSVVLRWAQVNSNATPTTVLENSFLIAHKV